MKNEKTSEVNGSGVLPQKEYLSQEVFANPNDFLKTLKDHFQKLSYGNDTITKEALQEYIAHGDDPKAKVAASIASEHFNVLAKINDLDSGITLDNLNFAMSEVNHTMSKYISDNRVTGTTLSGLTILVGTGYGAAWLNDALREAENGRPAGAAVCGVIGIGLVAGGLGFGGFLGKAAYDEDKRLHEGVKRDVLMFNQWFAKPTSSIIP